MASRYRKSWGWLVRQLRNKFILGILVIVPLSVTIWVLVWVFNSIDNILQPAITSIWERSFPGVGFGVLILLVYLAGIIASSVIGKNIIAFGERLLGRVPLVRQLYGGIKLVLEGFAAPDKTGFMQVVFVEFPRKGMQTIGFVTNRVVAKSGERLFTVYIPTSPTPNSGFLQIVREDEIIPTNITMENALKVIVSAGLVPLEGGAVMGKQESDIV